ncbi:MAG TPA: response regulator [Gemmatimonadales bacterium]|nr:response regulator [Gemmatimonadales bacterium]
MDDEPFIGRIVRLEFERGPYQVSIAHDGEEGLRFLREHDDVDLVLLDVNLPARSGLDLLAEARADPRLSRVPFIVLTAAGQSATAERAGALGAAGFVTKPFSPRKLLRQVAAILGDDAAGGTPA